MSRTHGLKMDGGGIYVQERVEIMIGWRDAWKIIILDA